MVVRNRARTRGHSVALSVNNTTPLYIASGINNIFPSSFTSSANQYRCSVINRPITLDSSITSAGGFIELYLLYTNWAGIAGGTQVGNETLTVQPVLRKWGSGSVITGTCVANESNTLGGASYTMATGGYCVFKFVMPTPAMNGDKYHEIVDVIGGTAGTINRLVSHQTVPWNGEGQLGASATVPGTGLAAGGAVLGYGATATPVLSAGAINSLTINAGGGNWISTFNGVTAAKNAYFHDARNESSVVANYALTLTGSVVTAGFKNAGGAGFTNTPSLPETRLWNGITSTQVYGAALMFGKLSDSTIKLVSSVDVSDSRGIGVNSTDGNGDILGCKGTNGRAFANKVGLCVVGVSGDLLSHTANTRYKTALEACKALGLRINNYCISRGVNDWVGNSALSVASMEGYLSTHRSYWEGTWGAKGFYRTIDPYITSATNASPASTQAPFNSALGTTGATTDTSKRGQWNASILARSGAPYDFYYAPMNTLTFTQDATYPASWSRATAYQINAADGAHLGSIASGSLLSGTTYKYNQNSGYDGMAAAMASYVNNLVA